MPPSTPIPDQESPAAQGSHLWRLVRDLEEAQCGDEEGAAAIVCHGSD
jgi:hypothetical protein